MLRQARRQREGEAAPREVLLEITNRCNLRCLHCYFDPYSSRLPLEELTTSEVGDILKQCFEIGVTYVTFSGGEPLCRPDIFEVMDYAQRIGLFFGIKTNGTMITEAVADRLKKLGIIGADVSLYGATAATHEYVTGVPGSYDKTIRAIRHLRERKVWVGIRTSVMGCNVREIQEIEDLAKQLGARYSADPLLFPAVGKPGSAAALRMDNEQLKAFIRDRSQVSQDTELTALELQRHLICSAARTKCAVSPQGEVVPCVVWRLSLGDLRRQTLKEIWQGEIASGIRATGVSDLPTCNNCELAGYCLRCPGMLYMEKENSGISGPSSENCRLARAAKEVKNDARQEILRKSGNRVGTD